MSEVEGYQWVRVGPAASDSYIEALEDVGASEEVVMAAKGYARYRRPSLWRRFYAALKRQGTW